MKKLMIASACVFALATGGALAQNQPAPGASTQGNVGPGATSTSKHMKKGTTTGMGSGSAHHSKSSKSSKHMSAHPSDTDSSAPGSQSGEK